MEQFNPENFYSRSNVSIKCKHFTGAIINSGPLMVKRPEGNETAQNWEVGTVCTSGFF